MKNHLTILIFLFFSFQAKAQEWLLNFDAGYGFNIATESILWPEKRKGSGEVQGWKEYARGNRHLVE